MTELPQSRAKVREAFVRDVAPDLAVAVGASTPWRGPAALSRRFAWFHDDDRLVVVGCPGESHRDVEPGLAYGLALVGDRELILVLEASTEESTCRRLPWIDVPVRLYRYAASGVEWCPPLSRHEVFASFDDEVVTAVHRLGNRSGWVESLMSWAGDCPELVAAHRGSYLAWHCRGRMVLKIRKTAGGLAVTAGVHSTVAGHQPHEVILHGSIEPVQFHRLVAVASQTIADRLAAVDVANAEHRLQERLAEMRSKLGLTATVREFPAMRPVNNRGYIDLLGVGRDSAIHVVETKIGADPMLVLQGLDYWVWTTAHLTTIVEHLNAALGAQLPAEPAVLLDFVVAAKPAGLMSPYTASQLEALDGCVPWQVHRFDGWESSDVRVKSFGRRRVPGGPRVAPPTFAVDLQSQLVDRTGPGLVRRAFFAEPGGGVIEVAKPAFELLRQAGMLHRFIDHVRSSQAFALNLFGGLSPNEAHAIWSLLGTDDAATVEVELEYTDPLDHLAESQSARPHRTQVDVLLRGKLVDDSEHVALIEVKLAETGFGPCSAFGTAGNNRREVCRKAGPWGGDRDGCYQLRNHGGVHRRRYDDHLKPEWVASDQWGCPFRDLNQAMRNVALARALIDRGEALAATFAVYAPRGNHSIWRQWRRAEAVFADVPYLTVAPILVEDVLAAVDEPRREAIRQRYGFEPQSS